MAGIQFMNTARLIPLRIGAAVGLLSALLTGCGGGPYPVEGEVLWKDHTPAKELAGSHVIFELPEKKISVRGIIQADGTFRLSAPAGDYQVLILEDRKNANPEGTRLLPEVLDSRYAKLKTTNLSATVRADTNRLTLTVQRAARP